MVTDPLLETRDPIAASLARAIRAGDTEALAELLQRQPPLARARIVDRHGDWGAPGAVRSLLHVATDWPGHFPNELASMTCLIDSGADVNARFEGGHRETPLHWAASSDDVTAVDLLLDRGADIDADGSIIGNGAALANAVAFGQWRAARRLVERGARSTLWQAAALGLSERVQEEIARQPELREITKAFWCACHGGQREIAQLLLRHGADLNWIGFDHLTPLDAATRQGNTDLSDWLIARGARSAKAL